MAERRSAVENLVTSSMSAFGDIYRDQDVVVTGHTGFKGAWLSLWLTSLGARVHGYSKDTPTDPSLFQVARLEEVIDHTIGDIRDCESFRALLHRTRPRFVFHLAAQAIVSMSYKDPIETLSSNFMGTAQVLEALRSATWPCAAVIVSSDKCYDNVEWPWGYRETDALGGKDVYSGSKGAAELAIRCYFHSFFAKKDHPVRIGVARAGNVIGGGDWAVDRLVADCIRAWTAGQRVQLRSPAAIRPWQHVLEPLSGYLVLGAALVRSKDTNGEAFNFGPSGEQNKTVVELLGDLCRIWGKVSSREAYEIVGEVPFREAGVLKVNCDKASMALKWRPTLTYDECVEMTGTWYRQVLLDRHDARALTLSQVERYADLAAQRQLPWRISAEA